MRHHRLHQLRPPAIPRGGQAVADHAVAPDPLDRRTGEHLSEPGIVQLQQVGEHRRGEFGTRREGEVGGSDGGGSGGSDGGSDGGGPDPGIVCKVNADCKSAAKPCEVGVCNLGFCAFPKAGDGAACNDGSACTKGDACKGGACQAGAAIACDDGNPCTDDSCDSKGGCVHPPNTKLCEDGSACTFGDACKAGICTPAATLTCSDGNLCTHDGCDPKVGCVFALNTGACSDNNACTKSDACKDGVCTPGPQLPCNDGNPCTDDSCHPTQGCVFAANLASCADGSACTIGDACQAGACKAGPTLPCADGNPCTTDACAPASGCTFTPNTAACTDNNACTQGDACKAGFCNPGAAIGCNDNNGCTIDSCDPGKGCVYTALPLACSDGSLCTTNDVCTDGVCKPGGALPCADGNPCTTDGCAALTGCAFTPHSDACDDGNSCTVKDACAKGSCAPGAAKACDDGNLCTADACDPKSGCANVATSAACSDDNLCTTSDACVGGVCKSGAALQCSDGNPCTDDGCDAKTGCKATPNAATCNDNSSCTTGDACVAGACTPKANLSCNDGNACTADACDPAKGCSNTPAAGSCSDNNSCTGPDVCNAGACKGGSGVVCNDNNACTDDSCDTIKGCLHIANSAACSDGKECTVGDACSGGKCQPGTAKPYVQLIPVVQTESGNGKVDVVLLIDSSGSMDTEIGLVNGNLVAFRDILTKSGLDWRLIVIGFGSGLCKTGCTADPKFQWVQKTIGSHDSLKVMVDNYSAYQGFMRADAIKNVIVVSDDESMVSAASFKSSVAGLGKFGAMEAAPLGFVFHSIVSYDPNNVSKNCSTGKAVGNVYLSLTAETKGSKHPVCASDWKPVFESLANSVAKTTFTICDYEVVVPTGATYVPSELVLSAAIKGPPQSNVSLVQISGKAGCAAQPKGWYFSNPAAPNKVVLCEAQCQALTAADSMSLDYGCK